MVNRDVYIIQSVATARTVRTRHRDIQSRVMFVEDGITKAHIPLASICCGFALQRAVQQIELVGFGYQAM